MHLQDFSNLSSCWWNESLLPYWQKYRSFMQLESLHDWRMEFADFDDDLFEEKPARGSVTEDYSARVCEAGWFMHVKPGQLVSQEDKLSALKFAADYLFLNKSYDAAVVKYEDMLNRLPQGNTTTRRECLESLARCHIKKGTSSMAVSYAERLHSTSKTSDQTTVSYSVLLDSYLAEGRCDEALKAAQNLVSLHPDNSYLWMKLGFVYAWLKSIKLSNVENVLCAHLPEAAKTSDEPSIALHSCAPGSCLILDETRRTLDRCEKERSHAFSEDIKNSSSRKDILVVAACLQRAYHILRKTEGTAVGFAISFTKTYKELLLADIKLLLDEDSRTELIRHLHENDKVEASQILTEPDVTSNFVDRGSSKYVADEKSKGELVSQEIFEEKWFKWLR